MPIGAYSITNLGNPGGSVSYYAGAYTICERGSFSVDVVLRSVIFVCEQSTAAAGVKPVVYTDSGTRLAEGTLTTVTGTIGETFELSLPSVSLAAGMIYRIGLYQSAIKVRVQNGAAIHVDHTSPVASWNEVQGDQYYINGDGFPSTTNPWELVGGFSFDPANWAPNPPSDVTVSQSRVPQGQSADVIWTHNDPDGDPQAQYEIRWRRV